MKTVKKIIYQWVDRFFLGGCSSYNSLDVRKSCRTKFQARSAFAENNIPHARGTLFLSPLKAQQFAKEHGFPLVIKPDVSGFSRGSHFPITNFFELWKAAILVKIWWPVSVIERYLEGKNYRILVAEGKIMSVIRRYPPFVDGDGRTTIAELIDRENATRKEMGLYPVIQPIPKDKKIIHFLLKKDMTLGSIPSKGERVTLFNKISLAPGGVVETIDKSLIAGENKVLFQKILSLFKANILGIDAIFEKGIETSFKQQQCIFLEVNSRPFLKMHDFPRYGKKEDLRIYFEELDQLEINNSDIF